MGIELRELCTIDIALGEQVMVGRGPHGTRVIGEIGSGTVTGDRLAGTIRPQAGADWLTLNGTIGAIDVRITIETGDGASILCTYTGRIDLSGGVEGAVARTAPTFETGHPDYAWLNAVQVVARGETVEGGIRYEVYEVV